MTITTIIASITINIFTFIFSITTSTNNVTITAFIATMTTVIQLLPLPVIPATQNLLRPTAAGCCLPPLSSYPRLLLLVLRVLPLLLFPLVLPSMLVSLLLVVLVLK